MSNFISFITVINLYFTDISQKMILVSTNFLSVCNFCIFFFNSSLLKKMLVVVFFYISEGSYFPCSIVTCKNVKENASTGENF